jgi:hypothetical protein
MSGEGESLLKEHRDDQSAVRPLNEQRGGPRHSVAAAKLSLKDKDISAARVHLEYAERYWLDEDKKLDDDDNDESDKKKFAFSLFRLLCMGIAMAALAFFLVLRLKAADIVPICLPSNHSFRTAESSSVGTTVDTTIAAISDSFGHVFGIFGTIVLYYKWRMNFVWPFLREIAPTCGAKCFEGSCCERNCFPKYSLGMGIAFLAMVITSGSIGGSAAAWTLCPQYRHVWTPLFILSFTALPIILFAVNKFIQVLKKCIEARFNEE